MDRFLAAMHKSSVQVPIRIVGGATLLAIFFFAPKDWFFAAWMTAVTIFALTTPRVIDFLCKHFGINQGRHNSN